LPDNRILFGTRGDLTGSDQSNLAMSKKMEKFLKDIFLNGLMLQLIIIGEA
jgi:hypothetical protein